MTRSGQGQAASLERSAPGARFGQHSSQVREGIRQTSGAIRAGGLVPTALATALALFALFAGGSEHPLPAQETMDLTGVVRDSASSEAIPNAVVSVQGAPQSTLTDSFGRFSLVGVPPAPQTLEVTFMGYGSVSVPLEAAPDGPIEVLLAPRAIEIEGVTVETSSEIVQSSETVSQVAMSPARLNTLPSLGEADVFRSLQLLPGISGTNDASSGLFVRGGTPDENLVLLDGMTVYHVDHFFGVFSAFNPDALKDIRLYKGGYPARYGGRTSSVVEMVGKSGDPDALGASASMNLLSASAVTEVPLGGKGSWLVSARRSYTDIIQTPLYDDIFGTLEGGEGEEGQQTGGGPGAGGPGAGGFGGFQQEAEQPSFYFYDVNSKLTYSPSVRDVFTASVYVGGDHLDESSAGQEFTFGQGQTRTTPDRVDLSSWGNRGASARWARQWSSHFTSDLLAAYSEYFSDGSLEVAATDFGLGFDESNRVADFTARLDNTWRPSSSSSLGFGLHLTRSDVEYQFDQLRGDSITRSLELGNQGRLAAGYVEHSWQPTERLDVTAGLRAATFDQMAGVYWEPRASARFELADGLSLKGAWGRYNQFVKRIENEDVLEGSREFWLLAGEDLAPQSAEHRIAGIRYDPPGWLFDVEVYDKHLDGVSQFSTRARTNPGQRLEELFFSGTGRARGVELLAQRTEGALTGWTSYTLSSVEYELEGFNEGDAFPASHDQRHEVKTVASYQRGPWVFSGTWVFGSGRPYTVPESQYGLTLLDGETISYIHVGEKNGQRLPAYHRLDLSASRRFETERYFYELNFSVYNAYGRDNVWYRQFDLSELPMVVTDVTTLGFTPSIGFRIGLR